MWHCLTYYAVPSPVQTLQSFDETLVCGHLNESYWLVLSSRTVYHAVQLGSKFG